MAEYLNKFVELVLAFRAAAGDFFAPNLYIFEIASLAISTLLIWGIIYAAIESNFFVKRIEEWMDFLTFGDVGKMRQLIIWKKIIKKMNSKTPTDWKVAILDADKILDDTLRAGGYRAPTLEERFKLIEPIDVANQPELMEAHKIRNRIAQEPDFELPKEEAVRVLRIYKKSLQEFGLLD